MIKRLTAITSLVAGLSVCIPTAMAASSASGAVEDVLVSTTGNGYLRIKIDGASANDGCTSGDTNLFYTEAPGATGGNVEYFETFLSLALTAKSSAQDLVVGLSGCMTIGGSTYPKISYIRM